MEAMSDRQLSLLLEEYKELGAVHRHEDTLKWALFMALVIASAFCAIAIVLGEEDPRRMIVLLLIPVALLVIGRAFYHAVHDYTLGRLARAHEIEERLGFETHRRFANPVVKAEQAIRRHYGVTRLVNTSVWWLSAGIVVMGLLVLAWK